MADTKLSWYSINSVLATEEHPPVDLPTAIQIVDKYFARADAKYEWGEDALASTMFGFSQSKNEFIEICINGSTQISYTFESPDPTCPWFLKPWKGTFQYETDLRSREEMVARVREFFSTPALELMRRLKSVS